MSLRARFLCLVLLVTLLPALILSWRFVVENDAEIAVALKNLASAANSVAASLEHRVQGTAQLHYGLAHSRILDSEDRKLCSAYLSEVREAYPQYTGIITVLPNGQLHCDSLQSGRTLNLRDRPYVQWVLAGSQGLTVEPAFGRLTGNSVLQIVYPARTEAGTLRFMLVASLNLRKFADDAQRQLLQPSSELLMVDDKGVVMVWSGAPGALPVPGSSMADSALFRLARSGGTGEWAGADGELRVWAVADWPAMRSAGLHVLLGQPRQALLAAPKQHLRQGLIMLAGAALMLFVGVGSLVEWGLRRQVVRIVSMVQELGAGNADARIPQPHPRGELGGLMAVLNRTADSLQAQRQAIDQLAQELQTAHGREIAEREENELRLSRMANFDSLTGLPNRALFQDRLQQAITRSRRLARPFALMFLDIDRFKNINDSLGHDVGDRLLKAVAQTLATTVREVDTVSLRDGPGRADEVFRLGGDEFMVLAEDLSDTGAAMGIARRVLVALDCAFVVDDHELFISASIGITLHGGDGVDMDGLIKQADLAMYRAKELGRGTWCFYDETMNQVAIQRHQLEMGLRRALERQEFVLHYQPKADLKTGRITGIEALLRWQPAGQAMVAPDRFITVLEETGLIVPVGEWVLREACGQMVRWQAQGMRAIGLAVNLSARQFRHHDLAAQISAILGETGLAPALLEVELTESMLLDDTDAVLSTLTALGAMGVRIAIDDFGTGHSSLRYIQRFSVDTLKIDRSFVRQTPGNADDCAIATAVIALGRSMGLKVVAEGVETPAQMEFLASQACDEMQGYLLSRPLDPGKFFDWLSCRESSEQAAAV